MATAALQKRQQSLFSTIHTEGALLPLDVLQRIEQLDANLGGLTAHDYHHEDYKLNEVINDAWLKTLNAWQNFRLANPTVATSQKMTLERWLLPLFRVLGYGQWMPPAQPIEAEGKYYAVSHLWHRTPIHLIGFRQQLDEVVRTPGSTLRSSAYGLVQELLNRSNDHLWGMVSNGLRLYLLRKNVSLTRQAYIEFDLEAMMQGEAYADFTLLWLLCHQSRVEADRSADYWLEKWARAAHEQGIRALDQLREGVEQAINALGKGFLTARGPANTALREKLHCSKLSAQDYYRQVLRLVYRLIVLFVAEDREVLFHPQASGDAKQRYLSYYSTRRLRILSDQRMGTRHTDLFQGLWVVMNKLGQDHGARELGLPALNGFLFSPDAVPDLLGCNLSNNSLLDAIRSLAYTIDRKAGVRRPVNYKHLGSEELGSVYESLLELHPDLNVGETGPVDFRLRQVSGNERKTSGSYYTPTNLIDCLLDSALNPVLEEACQQLDPEQAILDLKVCDPACGSGHFLIAAAHRIAKKLAAIRTGDEEPGPDERRRALRDVVGRCIYGVDINPMAVELCKVSLWMEAIEPGKPFSFLDTHILCGNSLLGATPALLAQGLPDSAFEPIEGDDKKLCTVYKKKNKQYRSGQETLFNDAMQPWNHQSNLRTSHLQIESISDHTVENIHRKQEMYERTQKSNSYLCSRLLADAWCAAFVWKKTKEFTPFITHDTLRNIERNPDSIPAWMRDKIEWLAGQYQFFHWHLAFPNVFREPENGEQPENEQAGWSGGFDVVLGNPPWEHTELKEQEWFATRNPEIANAAGAERKRKIEALITSDPALHAAFLDAKRQQEGWGHLIRNSARYPLCGRGRINTYAVFAENMHSIIGPRGRVGCIVPSGIATDDTTKYFFQDLMDTQSLASLYDFENREGIFPAVHRSYKFSLLTLTNISRPAKHDANFAFFAQKVEDLQDDQRRFTLSSSDVRLLNPNTRTCSIFRTKRDMELTKAIYQRTPVLIKEGPFEENLWNATFRQNMFLMTKDSYLFSTRRELEEAGWRLVGNVFQREEERYLPLYEGKMIWHFDHRLSTYDTSLMEFSDLILAQHQDAHNLSVPRYWVQDLRMPDFAKDGHKVFLAFRDVARSTDVRTTIFSLVPVMPCGHTLAILELDATYASGITYFAANATSFIFDYVARQKLGGTHMSAFVLKQLPVLPPTIYTTECRWNCIGTLGDWILPRALELTYTAWDLASFACDCGYDGPPFRWDEERRFLLRCELDAAFFHLYGIARDDVDYIMDTFRVWKQKEKKQLSEYRTKRVILEIYDEMQQAIESGESYQTRLDPLPADPRVAHPPYTIRSRRSHKSFLST